MTVPKKVVYRGGSLLDTLVLDVLAFAIEHPSKGIILVGAGLSRGVVDDADGYLGVFRTAIGSPTMAKGQDILSQLESAGLSEERVRDIILPDLRFSHTGELENFPKARVIVSSVEYITAVEEGESALSLSDEYDGVKQWQFVDFVGAEPLGTFHAHRDLFNDGSVLLIDIAGATPGGLAVLMRLPHAPVLLCGNLAWTAEQARYVREPGFVFNRQSWWENAWKLKKFTELVPELVILPDHEWEAVEAAKTQDMIVHVFPPVQEDKSLKKKGAENKLPQEKRNRVKKK
ncbi:MAG: MBL fold metallo-hydrolase [Candidatus Binatia bacterium]